MFRPELGGLDSSRPRLDGQLFAPEWHVTSAYHGWAVLAYADRVRLVTEVLDMRRRFLGFVPCAAIWLLPVFFLSSPQAQAVDFLRGDANGDSVVSLADAHFLVSFLFRQREVPTCLAAADVDNDGVPTLADAVGLAQFLALGTTPPAAPFPELGPDTLAAGPGSPSPSFADDCASYGGGSPLEDSSAALAILDGTVPGGADNTLRVRISLSSSATTGGYAGVLRGPGGFFLGVAEVDATDLSGTQEQNESSNRGVVSAMSEGARVPFVFLTSPVDSAPIPPSQSRVVLELLLYVAVGTPAGEYALSFESGEIVDFESGRAMAPALTGGTVTVAHQVTGDARSGVVVPTVPEDIDFTFSLGDGEAKRGEEVSVPFFILSNAVVDGYSLSVDFDESALELQRIEPVWERPDGKEFAFSRYEFNNQDDVPGDSGIVEGAALGAAVFDFAQPMGLPANTNSEILFFHFRVRDNAPVASTEIRFEDGAMGSGESVLNAGSVAGTIVPPAVANSFVFVNAQVSVLPEITLFRRGDTNGDTFVDLTDAQRTIDFLFLGAAPLACNDAADANDDGELDVSDPLAILTFLFLSSRGLPSPFGELGADPTPDDIDCQSGG